MRLLRLDVWSSIFVWHVTPFFVLFTVYHMNWFRVTQWGWASDLKVQPSIGTDYQLSAFKGHLILMVWTSDFWSHIHLTHCVVKRHWPSQVSCQPSSDTFSTCKFVIRDTLQHGPVSKRGDRFDFMMNHSWYSQYAHAAFCKENGIVPQTHD